MAKLPSKNSVTLLLVDQVKRIQSLWDLLHNRGSPFTSTKISVIWTLIMEDGLSHPELDRSWVDYENGLGDLRAYFWYGLKAIHAMTQWPMGNENRFLIF